MIDRLRKITTRTSRPGFTLVEMLVVIAVIVLAMTLAIPAIRSLTGSRSVEASENAITSYLAQVRAEAIGQQTTEGVMFLLDTPTDRVICVPVHDVTTANDNPPLSPSQPDAQVMFLDVISGRDPYYLPTGIRLFVSKDQPPTYPGTPYTDAFPNWRYLGANSYPPSSGPDANATTFPIGVVLFGADGKLAVQQYGLRLSTGGIRSSLAQLIYSGRNNSNVPIDWPLQRQHYPNFLCSSVGLTLVQKEEFLNGGSGFLDHDNPSSNESAVDAWIDANATPIIINRYDGTLMRAE